MRLSGKARRRASGSRREVPAWELEGRRPWPYWPEVPPAGLLLRGRVDMDTVLSGTAAICGPDRQPLRADSGPRRFSLWTDRT